MARVWMFAAGAALMTLSGGGLEVPVDDGSVPFPSPREVNNSLCRSGPDPSVTRRAYFIRVASAAASSPPGTAWQSEFEVGDTIPIRTRSAEAQSLFDAGMGAMFGFNHTAAANRFRAAQRADPACAMCYWGEALALGPNINLPMAEDANGPAVTAARKARSAVSEATPALERDLIEAVSTRYSEGDVDRAALDQAYASAMAEVAMAHPDSDLAAVLSAEADMDTSPWAYWEDGGRVPTARARHAITLLEAVLSRNPDYAPAIHLYIHMTEASTDPYRAEAHADRLAERGDLPGHLVHMPSHTYYKIGRYRDALDANVRAIRADADYLAGGEDNPFYRYAYFTHNIHFAMTSAQMGGDRDTVLEMADRLDAELPLGFAKAVPFVQPVKAAPLLARVQFKDWDALLAQAAPGGDAPFLQAVWHYARGEAFARRGDTESAEAERSAIRSLARSADFAGFDDVGVPARDILLIAETVLEARLEDARGNAAGAIASLEKAAALQNSLPYMEPPYWHAPINQSLAALLLREGQAERAEALFMRTLIEAPNSGWASHGLAASLQSQGHHKAARYAKELHQDNWFGARRGPELDDY